MQNPLPTDVLDWIRQVFAQCNARITEKLGNNPNAPEESLDLTWIEHLSQYSSPMRLKSNWTVRIDTHYLGGMRHYFNWEIADIGLLVFIKPLGSDPVHKVALLQSKRLYPKNNAVRELQPVDYEVGLARIFDPEDQLRRVGLISDFEFDEDCQFGALQAGSDQVRAILEYERKNKLSIYYQIYSPASLPLTIRVPLRQFKTSSGAPLIGTTVFPTKDVNRLLSQFTDGQRPTFKELCSVSPSSHPYGWRLEHFVADLVLGCTQGTIFDGYTDERIQTLFYRRSGPIAAGISIIIQQAD